MEIRELVESRLGCYAISTGSSSKTRRTTKVLTFFNISMLLRAMIQKMVFHTAPLNHAEHGMYLEHFAGRKLS